MRFIFLTMAVLYASGCVADKTLEPIGTHAPNQILVEARLMEQGVVFSSPRSVAANGTETRIVIGQAIDVPGLVNPVPTGVALTIVPRIQAGRIAFAGSCEVKRLAGELDQPGFQAASFLTREAYFAGIANSGEEKTMLLEQPTGPPLTLTLKFLIMVNTAGR